MPLSLWLRLQIRTLISAASIIRGLVVQGTWQADVLGECDVTLETLEHIAQELDDLEIMFVP